ncbi:hypothetical protein JCM11641_002062 [Rhodosporidiobolus odoratus]
MTLQSALLPRRQNRRHPGPSDLTSRHNCSLPPRVLQLIDTVLGRIGEGRETSNGFRREEDRGGKSLGLAKKMGVRDDGGWFVRSPAITPIFSGIRKDTLDQGARSCSPNVSTPAVVGSGQWSPVGSKPGLPGQRSEFMRISQNITLPYLVLRPELSARRICRALLRRHWILEGFLI